MRWTPVADQIVSTPLVSFSIISYFLPRGSGVLQDNLKHRCLLFDAEEFLKRLETLIQTGQQLLTDS